MRVWPRLLSLLLVSLAACAEELPKEIETRVLIVWEGGSSVTSGLRQGDLVLAPNLSACEADGHLVLQPPASTPSRSSALASFLTGLSPQEHGLLSAHELGASVLHPEVQTRAEALPEGVVRLGAVSRGHFAWQGLDRGIDRWHGPAFSNRHERWAAEQVWQAVRAPLDQALSSEAPVLLVMHFDDLLSPWSEQGEPTREQLELGLSEWRGKQGLIDEQFSVVGSSKSLALRLTEQLMRRKSDPRRAALERSYRAATVAKLDGILGEVRALLESHRRLNAARFELSLGANPSTSLPAGQEVKLTHEERLEGLQVSVVLADGVAEEIDSTGSHRFPGRGAELLLRIRHPRLFYLGLADVQLGATSLGASDVPVFLARQSKPWPTQSLTGPLLDFEKDGGRRLRGKVQVPEGVEVEIQLTQFPQDMAWSAGVDCPQGEVSAHHTQPGVAVVRGQGSLEFRLPPSSPRSRLGVVLRLDGERVSGSRMRYMGRSFVATNGLDLGFSASSWLGGPLCEQPEEATNSAIHVQLHDSLALLPALGLTSPEELALLRGLAEDD